MQGNLAFVLAEFLQLEAVGGVLRILAGSVVALLAAVALQGNKGPISLWHLSSPV